MPGAMRNSDFKNEKYVKLQEDMKNAIEEGDFDSFAKVQIEMANKIQDDILNEAKNAIHDDYNDTRVLADRGLNTLTAEETKYYNEVIGGEGFDGVEELMPATIFDRVFEELKEKHAILNEIDFVNTTGVTEWITRNGTIDGAFWGKLTAAITKKLEMAFKKERTGLYKLSAYVPVAKAMLDLGPQWLDRFVRAILLESIAIALEIAIISGDGKDKPIGMIKNLEGAVVDGVYPDKDTVAITDLEPKTLGKEIMAPLTKGGKRAVPKVLLVVNPIDYWEKIYPQTTFLSADKSYVYGVLPIPAKIIQSVAVTQGQMVAGMGKDYFMGVGSTQKVEYSDHYKFLEDERTYIAKQYANGKPVDNESFLLFDISGIGAPEV